MITHIPATQRYHAKQGWLDTYHLFSFANYFDPENLQFGTLRVFNDDTIDAYAGFDEHSHENMEIVTIMHEGELTHRDSMGNMATIHVGEIQRMSAGTGVIHAEKNLGGEQVHLYQLWFLPVRHGLEPSYEQKDFSYLIEKNTLSLVASDLPTGEAIKLQANAHLFLGDFDAEKTTEYTLETGRGVFIYVTTGMLKIHDLEMGPGDQARIQSESLLQLAATTATRFVFIDVPLTW